MSPYRTLPSTSTRTSTNGHAFSGGPLRGVSRVERRQDRLVAQGLGDDIKNFFDSLAFEKWAPRSSQAWRLGQSPSRAQDQRASNQSDELFQALGDQLSQSRDEEEKKPKVENERTLDELVTPNQSFSESTDEDLASALNRKIEAISLENSQEEQEEEEVEASEYAGDLTGSELSQLIFEKYGSYYDAEFARRDFVGKPLVSMNIMWVHLQQRSFPMSQEEYMDKMDGMAYLLNAWSRSEKVRSFLKAPRKSQKGLPSKPIVGCAVSIQLDLEENIIEEWFGKKG